MTCEGTYLDLALNKHDSKTVWILLLTMQNFIHIEL
jgi:hypothetical protein